MGVCGENCEGHGAAGPVTAVVGDAAARPVLVFSRAHARLALCLGIAFVVLVAARIHGYSISIWHALDGSPPTEVLWGEPRFLRVDDWLVQIPTSLAQRAHAPRFPVWNDKIGLGQNMLVPLQLPVMHPLLLLRPFEWGWLLGGDTGLAWKWWLQAFGLFACVFLVLEIVDGGRFWLSAAGSLFLLFSPFFQFWSLNASPVVCYAALVFVSGCHVLFAGGRGVVFGNALLLGWSAAAFLLSFYPPYEILLAQLFALLFATTLLERIREQGLPRHLGERAAALGIAAFIVTAAVALAWRDAGPAIHALQDSVYPGSRLNWGGEQRLWEVFVHNCVAALVVSDWSPLRDLQQAASFWLLFPVAGAGLLLRVSRPGARADGMALALLVYCLLLVAYATLALPPGLVRVLFLGRVPTARAALGLGVAQLVLLVRFLGARREADCGRGTAAAIALAWGGAMAWEGWTAHRVLAGIGTSWLAGAALLNVGVAYALLRSRRPALVLAALSAIGLASSAWFNPVVRGGADYFQNNPVSQAIREFDAEGGGDTTWLVFNDESLGNLFRALNIRSVAGLFPVPQLALWQRLDPHGAFAAVYNRYANANFTPLSSSTPRFELFGPDVFLVYLPTDLENLRRLGVTNVVFKSDGHDAWDKLPGLRFERSIGKLHFYRVVPAPASVSSPLGGDVPSSSRTGDAGG